MTPGNQAPGGYGCATHRRLMKPKWKKERKGRGHEQKRNETHGTSNAKRNKRSCVPPSLAWVRIPFIHPVIHVSVRVSDSIPESDTLHGGGGGAAAAAAAAAADAVAAEGSSSWRILQRAHILLHSLPHHMP